MQLSFIFSTVKILTEAEEKGGKMEVQSRVVQQASFPQMYMHALLGPATVGLQMPLVHVTLELMAADEKL
jgi:hypothetical protein